VQANDEQLEQVQLQVEDKVQQYWRQQLATDPKIKLDDVGDALLHALDELLCSSTNFKQLVPAAPPVNVNRTVEVAVFPDITYWMVLHCQWNTFLCENFGCFRSSFRSLHYKDLSTAERIKKKFTQRNEI